MPWCSFYIWSVLVWFHSEQCVVVWKWLSIERNVSSCTDWESPTPVHASCVPNYRVRPLSWHSVHTRYRFSTQMINMAKCLFLPKTEKFGGRAVYKTTGEDWINLTVVFPFTLHISVSLDPKKDNVFHIAWGKPLYIGKTFALTALASEAKRPKKNNVCVSFKISELST